MAASGSNAGVGASADAERAMLDVFLTLRAYHLLAGALSVALDRRRYRRPALAAGLLVAAVAESAWVARQTRSRQSVEGALTGGVDAGFQAAVLPVLGLALSPTEQFNATNWVFPMTLMTSVAASAAFRRRGAAIASASALAASYAATATAFTSGSKRPALVGLWQYLGAYATGAVLIRRLRRTASEIEVLHDDAVEHERRRAEDDARARMHRELHGGALTALQDVRALWTTDRDAARARARTEAVRLRGALQGRLERGAGLTGELEAVVADAAGRGIRVELVPGDLAPEPTGAAVDGLVATIRVALADGDVVGRRVVLRARRAGEIVLVTLRDHSASSALREAASSRTARDIEAAGGCVDVWAEAGRGSRLTIEVPV
jgi:hypothetical protein